MEKLKRTFKAPKGVTEFSTITIKEVDGGDELQAAAWSGARGKGDSSVEQFKDLVRASIVAVDGKPFNQNGVANPEFDAWKTKTRNVVVRFYGALNSVDQDDLDRCVAEGMGLLPAPSPAQAPSDRSETPSGG